MTLTQLCRKLYIIYVPRGCGVGKFIKVLKEW